MSDGMVFGLAIFVLGVATSAVAVFLGRNVGTAAALSVAVATGILYGIVWAVWPGIASDELRPWTPLGLLGILVGSLLGRASSGTRT